ncbi:MAG: cytochrome b/b6 domain-containing protein [Limisphaerales bacterium]
MKLLLICGWALVAGWTAFAANSELIPDSDCLDCHGQNDLTKTDAAGREISLFVDQARLQVSVHGTNLCASCHSDVTREHPDDQVTPKRVDCRGCHEGATESYEASAHGLALAAGEPGAATCTDCHGTHEILLHTAPQSRMHFSNLTTTCGECHPDAANDLQESLHGRAAGAGDRDAATCTDCHSGHRVEGLKSASPLKVAATVCGKCHASERINTKFRLPRNRVETFFESYHGLAVQGGLAKAANCASCHGYHRILPSSDPRSSIHPTHLVETCGKCHPGATENFALGRIHVDGVNGNDIGTQVNRWVRVIYLGLIFFTISLMVAHNGLSWIRFLIASYRRADRTVPRMDRAQRVQHLVLMISFVVLALSGFALKFPDSWLGWSMGGEEMVRRWIHRIAGVVLLGVGSWHLLYLAVRPEGRRLFRDLLPCRDDLTDLAAHVRPAAHLRAPVRTVPRFRYVEKLEYWAVIWGTIIMGVTGLAIWLKMPVTQVFPRWVVDVAITAHYYEAILACLAIIVWHFYHVMFAPAVYPMNWAWLDGKARPETDHDESASTSTKS